MFCVQLLLDRECAVCRFVFSSLRGEVIETLVDSTTYIGWCFAVLFWCVFFSDGLAIACFSIRREGPTTQIGVMD